MASPSYHRCPGWAHWREHGRVQRPGLAFTAYAAVRARIMIWDRFDVIAWKAHTVQPLQHITTVFLAQSRRESFQWKRFLRQRWDVESATVVVAWSSWQRLEQAICFILQVERQAAYLMILLDIFPHNFLIYKYSPWGWQVRNGRTKGPLLLLLHSVKVLKLKSAV
jgi:hypothetical protein